MKESSPYFEIEVKDNKKTAKVHAAVNDTIDALSRDQKCRVGENTAIKDLLDIVKTKLLVVNLGAARVNDREAIVSLPHDFKTQIGFRASARELCVALDKIIGKGEKNERYWYKRKPRSHIQRLPIPSQALDSLLPPDSAYGQSIPARQKEPMQPLLEDITFVIPSGNQGLKVRKTCTKSMTDG
jgi:hypothetical protein